MRQLHLRSITIASFRSFEQSTTINFGDAGGLRMLYGINEVEPRLGGNGAGKSTTWDALCWCWYNFSARNLRSSELTTWGSTKSPYVATDIEINGNPMRIERYGSPNRLLLDGEPIEQDKLEREVLGLSRGRFLHSVLYGQLVRSFIDLSVAERGGLLDEVLNLGLWLRASEAASAQHSALIAQITAVEAKIAYAKGRLDSLLEDSDLAAQAQTWADAQEARIACAIDEAELAEKELALTEQALRSAQAALQSAPSTETLTINLRQVEQRIATNREQTAVLVSEHKRLLKEEFFFRDSPELCPTCSQAITKRFAGAKIRDLQEQREGVLKDAEKHEKLTAQEVTALPDIRGLIEQRNRARQQAQQDVKVAENLQKVQARRVNELLRGVENALAETNPYSEQIARNAEQRKSFQREVSKLTIQRCNLQDQSHVANYWKQGFKKVRLFQTKRSLDLLKVEVANSARELGLIGWSIDLVTEVETKSGTMKQGVQIIVTSPKSTGMWEAWSGGEGQRIRLAVSMGLASLIQRMAGIYYQFEIFDEPSAWLSPEGIDDLLDCLASRSAATGKTVWILDHRALSHAGFSEIWQVTKTEQGSAMQRVN